MRWKETWKNLLVYERVFYILDFLLIIGVILLFGFAAFMPSASKTYLLLAVSLLGLEDLCGTVHNWRRNRLPAVISLCCGIFLLLAVLLMALFC